jgi:tetratricopeptide (TPR) repeat protein
LGAPPSPPSREHTDRGRASPFVVGSGGGGGGARHRWAARLRDAGVLVGVCLRMSDSRTVVDCEQAVRTGNAGVAVAACQEEYKRTEDPRTGAHLANALRRAGDLDGAGNLASALIATSASADALYVLGKIAIKRGQLDVAEQRLRDAAELHRGEGRLGELAKDQLASGELANARERYADALIALDRCISAAREGSDRSTEGNCRLAAAHVLVTIGYGTGAWRELSRAEPLLATDSDRTSLELARGNYYQERGENEQAVNSFRRALALAERAALPRMARSIHLNLVYSLARIGQLDEAARHARRAEILSRGDEWLARRREALARIALLRGDRAGAARLAEEALASTREDAHDERYEIESLRAEIALGQGDAVAAESWARRAIDDIEQMRAKQAALQLRTWVMTHRWEPYELLFASLARRGDAAGALIAFERWQGRALLDRLVAVGGGGALEQGLPAAGHGTAEPAALRELRELDKLITSLQGSPLATPAPDAQVLAAARAGSLLILAIAGGELWRITAEGGALEVASVGQLLALGPRLDRFRTRPDDAALAAELGALLVPPALARPGAQALHVVLDERDAQIAQLPIAALRVGGRPLVWARPVVRAVRPSDVGCEPPPPPPRRAAVIADAVGNLPGARREAEEIGQRLAASIALGPRATRAALLGAAAGDLLHIAVHAKVDELGGVLELADGPVSALEIAGQRRSAGRVVLAACASGAAEPATHSVAMGFLAAGARQVIATLRDVDDAAAARLTRELYRGDVTDLARALARLQAAAASAAAGGGGGGTGGSGDGGSGELGEWLKFAVFGRAICDAAQ